MSADSHLALIPLLIGEFPRWLDYFAQHGPFRKPDQLARHRNTIELRLGHTSASGAIADPMFVESLYETLKAWGIGSRRSRLHPLQQFHAALLAAAPHVSALETLRIDAEAWFEVPGATAAQHRAELNEFAIQIGADTAHFSMQTYQELFLRMLPSMPQEHGQYIAYLQECYLSAIDL